MVAYLDESTLEAQKDQELVTMLSQFYCLLPGSHREKANEVLERAKAKGKSGLEKLQSKTSRSTASSSKAASSKPEMDEATRDALDMFSMT
eukprot:9137781-Lingulodinium_polyedra.AAC.1